jgi:hypothetical protein
MQRLKMALFSSSVVRCFSFASHSLGAGCGITKMPAEQARGILPKAYSPECVEGEFSEVCIRDGAYLQPLLTPDLRQGASKLLA